MILKTNGEDTLMTPMTDDEDTLTNPVMTLNYLVTTPHDVSNNPCDEIDDLYVNLRILHDWNYFL
jgi:hypothetical protein